MNKFLSAFFLVALAATATAQVQVRLATEIAAPWDGVDWSQIGSSWVGNNAGLGLTSEVIVDQIGFGFDSGARFHHDVSDQSWSLDFRGQVFTSYHPGGVESSFDPFVTAGMGSAGYVDLTHGVNRVAGSNLSGLALSLVPSLGGGVAVDLGGMVVGVRMLWYPLIWEIPVAPIDAYAAGPFEVGIFVAWAIGDHAEP